MLELSARIKCVFYDKEIAFLYDEKGFDNALDYGSCLLEAWSNIASRNTGGFKPAWVEIACVEWQFLVPVN